MHHSQRHHRLFAALLTALLPLVLVAMALVAVAQLPEREGGHRPLRANPEGEPPDQKPAESFTGYADAPNFTVVGRVEELNFFPCSNCHAAMSPNPERRELMSPHPAALDHGDGRFWCLDCHVANSRNDLATAAGEHVTFDQADQVCAQCHYDVHRDWTFGVHGKRVENWQGPREYYSCAHCHNPHDPAVRPRAPEDPPRVRAGLEPMPDTDHDQPLYRWLQQQQERSNEDQDTQ